MHTVCSDCISNGILNILPCSSSPDPFLLPALFHDLSATAEIFEKTSPLWLLLIFEMYSDAAAVAILSNNEY